VTLAEVVVYTTLLAGICVPLVSTTLASLRTMTESEASRKAEERNRSLLNRIAGEIRMSIIGTAQVAATGRTLSFVMPLGFDSTGVLPGNTVTYDLLPASGELENGSDDNGDGLVDEAQLVRTEEGVAVPVCGDMSLAESGFALVDGTSVHLRLTHMSDLPDQADFRITREMTVNPRN
jgi:hypothetical protein